jgi:hypothetical protein
VNAVCGDLKQIKIPGMAKKLSPAVIAFLREQGAKGGRIGGRRSLETMTPAQRVARAKKASAAAAAARKRSAKKTK